MSCLGVGVARRLGWAQEAGWAQGTAVSGWPGLGQATRALVLRAQNLVAGQEHVSGATGPPGSSSENSLGRVGTSLGLILQL